METQSLWLQEAVRDKRAGLSKVHGPVNPADLMTKHVDHAVQIRLLSLMGVEARMGRAETAPETGKVDEQVRLVDLCTAALPYPCPDPVLTRADAGQELEEPECEITEFDEKEIDWIHESIDYWVTRLSPVPKPETAAAGGSARRRKPSIPNARRNGR